KLDSMRLKKEFSLICIALAIVISGIVMTNTRDFKDIDNISNTSTAFPQVLESNNTNSGLINQMFDQKLSEYDNGGYFSTMYESSIQATYYALYILDALGNLDQVNNSEIITYLLKYYDPATNLFMDKLAYRYLDTDFSQTYYPLSSVLQVNCYAVLSLSILNRLDLIDIPKMINFIWSCYNSESGGFIGQIYDSGLEEGLKLATLDNTYFAVSTLDLLMNSWIDHTSQKDAMIQFISDLQISGVSSWDLGGFFNDDDFLTETVFPLFEPNLFSSYWGIKTLEVFDMDSSIQVADFHAFLTGLYNVENDYFRISEWDYGMNYTNIVATALGLELSDITGFQGISRSEVITFILANRNSFGNWDQSTTIPHHELIDIFQIVRSLKNAGILTQLTLLEKKEIADSIMAYQHYGAYSSISEDYISMNLIYTITSSFDLFDRISELDIYDIYLKIKNSYSDSYETGSFNGYLADQIGFQGLRSHPIEYYTSGKRNYEYINQFPQLRSHQSTYYALASLKKMFKLDEFGDAYHLFELLNDIVNTQFLDDSYSDNYGAFTPLWPYEESQAGYLDKKISFEYSYFAIRSLEILGEQLGLGNVSNYGFNPNALYAYIDKSIVEEASTLYFSPEYSNDVETILQDTYYMIYILKSLNLYAKDSQKIEHYVISNLNYNNIKNIYYSYKIANILNLTIDFEEHLTQELIQNIYDSDLGEFYIATDREVIDQEIFLWLCEMARNSEIGFNVEYSSIVDLGEFNTISVSISNLIARDFGSILNFKFESDQLGTFDLNKTQDGIYTNDIPIPIRANCYPEVEGWVYAYEGTEKKGEYFISFTTSYMLNYTIESTITSTSASFQINSSIFSNQKGHLLTFGKAFTRIYKDDILSDLKYFNLTSDSSEYSLFSLTVDREDIGDCYFEIFLDDGIRAPFRIANATFGQDSIEDPNDDSPNKPSKDYGADIKVAVPLMVFFTTVPGSVIVISTKKLMKSKNKTLNR
ncbi:hypothetical protein LCGC14_1690700, partial [marine sediment metagenome]